MATIHLSSQRTSKISGGHTSYSIFGFGGEHGMHGQSSGSVRAFNDEMLGTNASVIYRVSKPSEILLIPLVGACTCKVAGKDLVVDAGELLHCRLLVDESIILQNDHETETIGYLYIVLDCQSDVEVEKYRFEPEKYTNVLHTIPISQVSAIHVGLFHGREEDELLRETGRHFLAFVIEGAFEVNGRLLERRDALTISNAFHLEFESLSSDGLIVILESPY